MLTVIHFMCGATLCTRSCAYPGAGVVSNAWICALLKGKRHSKQGDGVTGSDPFV